MHLQVIVSRQLEENQRGHRFHQRCTPALDKASVDPKRLTSDEFTERGRKLEKSLMHDIRENVSTNCVRMEKIRAFERLEASRHYVT